MHVRERMIRERIASQPCDGCGLSYGQGTVLVLARRPAAWLVLAACGTCERRCIYLVSFRDASAASGKLYDASEHRDAPSLSIQRAHALVDEATERPSSRVPITDGDVDAMRAFLARFDGDFQRLFAADGPSSA